jgi:hypothetical protein
MKRALHPQEFTALVLASSAFKMAGLFSGKFDLGQPLDDFNAKGRSLVVLRKKKF